MSTTRFNPGYGVLRSLGDLVALIFAVDTSRTAISGGRIMFNGLEVCCIEKGGTLKRVMWYFEEGCVVL